MDSNYEEVVNLAAEDAAEDEEVGTLGGLMPPLPGRDRCVVSGMAMGDTNSIELLGQANLGQAPLFAEVPEGFAVPFGNF